MMNDWNKLVLGEEDSQTAPVCNGTVREMIADIDRLKRYENIYRREFEAKQQLKAAEFEITELDGALSEVKRQLDASQALLAEANHTIERLVSEAAETPELLRQLAEVRAENERLKVIKWVQTESYEAVAAVKEARQEAARECRDAVYKLYTDWQKGNNYYTAEYAEAISDALRVIDKLEG